MYCSSRVRDSDSGPIVSTDVIGYDSLFGKFSFGGAVWHRGSILDSLAGSNPNIADIFSPYCLVGGQY